MNCKMLDINMMRMDGRTTGFNYFNSIFIVLIDGRRTILWKSEFAKMERQFFGIVAASTAARNSSSVLEVVAVIVWVWR